VQDVQALQFNILCTTYETIMNDRSKLSKVPWKYIIIDEAQRMKVSRGLSQAITLQLDHQLARIKCSNTLSI
jgi:SNF2 family DNA or RNA helicase